MPKLNYESKADFQAAYFGKIVEKYFEGGNYRGLPGNLIAYSIEQIVEGLSKAWDKAEEQS